MKYLLGGLFIVFLENNKLRNIFRPKKCFVCQVISLILYSTKEGAYMVTLETSTGSILALAVEQSITETSPRCEVNGITLRQLGFAAVNESDPDLDNPFNTGKVLEIIQKLFPDKRLQDVCDASSILQSWDPGGDEAVAQKLVADHGWSTDRADKARTLASSVEKSLRVESLRTPLDRDDQDTICLAKEYGEAEASEQVIRDDLLVEATRNNLPCDSQSIEDALALLNSNMPTIQLKKILTEQLGWTEFRYGKARRLVNLYKNPSKNDVYPENFVATTGSMHLIDDDESVETSSYEESEKPSVVAELDEYRAARIRGSARIGTPLVRSDSSFKDLNFPPGRLSGATRLEYQPIERLPASVLPSDRRDTLTSCVSSPETFFPEKGGSLRLARIACGNCEVQLGCAVEGLSRRERDGIWGGLSAREIRKINKLIATNILLVLDEMDDIPDGFIDSFLHPSRTSVHGVFIKKLMGTKYVSEHDGSLFGAVSVALSDPDVVRRSINASMTYYFQQRQQRYNAL